MKVATLTVTLHAPWVHSLKEKRMEVKSLLAKLRGRFNVSACEVAEQDLHQTIVLGIAAVVANTTQGDSTLDHVLNFIASTSQGDITKVERDIL